MDSHAVGRFIKPLDVVHSLGYFAPEVADQLVAAGLEPGGMGYFASRSAAMGEVGAGVVAATFYNFNPQLVAHFIPRAWSLCDPPGVLAARFTGIDAALRRILGDLLCESPEVGEVVDLLRIATDVCRPEGRPLYAAHADLRWPSESHLAMWHGLTLLREHRGDGHLIALQSVGLSGIEALITHTATGAGFTQKFARTRRAWSPEQWDEAVAGLQVRGILDEDGALTHIGIEVRQQAENLTDELAATPWNELGEQRVRRLGALMVPIHAAVLASGVFPDGTYGDRWAGGSFAPDAELS
jgi:hypothetical protein